jgi:hypothetical protein
MRMEHPKRAFALRVRQHFIDEPRRRSAERHPAHGRMVELGLAALDAVAARVQAETLKSKTAA